MNDLINQRWESPIILATKQPWHGREIEANGDLGLLDGGLGSGADWRSKP